MAKEIQISMQLLRNKILEGVKRIQLEKGQKEAVLFVGDSGVGKSTLLSYLIGDQLKIQQKGLKPCLVSCNSSKQIPLKIGHNKYSQTSIPIRVLFEGKAYYDCPGFNDNKSPECEIANSFYYQRLMSMYDQTKLVVVVDESYITESRAQQMPTLARKLQEAFGDLNNTRFSTLFVINRCHSDSTHADVEKEFQKLIKTQGLFNSEQIRYFDYLIENNSIFSFQQPKRKDIGNLVNPAERKLFQQKIEQLDFMDKVDIKNIISDTAKLAIRDYLDIVTERSQKLILKIMEELDKELVNSKGCIFLAKQQILKVFNYKDHMFSKGDFTSFLDFCVQRKVNVLEIEDFKADLEIADFFSKVYNKQKTQSYYLNTSSLILTRLSILLHKIDTMIEEQKLEIQRKKQKQELKIEDQRLEMLERGYKQNRTTLKRVKFGDNEYFEQNQNRQSAQSSVIAFQNKLANAQIKVRQISHDAVDLHSRVSNFSRALGND